IDIRNLASGGAVGFYGVDQRVELGKLARDPHVMRGVHLAKQLRLQRGVVRQENIKFGFGQHRHGLRLEWRNANGAMFNNSLATTTAARLRRMQSASRGSTRCRTAHRAAASSSLRLFWRRGRGSSP